MQADILQVSRTYPMGSGNSLMGPKDLGFPDASVKNYRYFLRRLLNLVTLVGLLVGDTAPRTVNEVCLEIRQTYFQRTKIDIISKIEISRHSF